MNEREENTRKKGETKKIKGEKTTENKSGKYKPRQEKKRGVKRT